MATPLFRYRSITYELLHEMTSDLERDRSMIVLGPSNAGKGFLARQLSRAIESRGWPIVKVNFRRCGPNANDARNLVCDAVRAAGLYPGSGDKILGPLSGVGPLYVFLTNPDALACGHGRLVLQDLWARIRNKSVVAIVRGEQGLANLLQEHLPDTTAIQHYVIQGIGSDLLGDYLRQYDSIIGMTFSDDVHNEIIRETGGIGDVVKTLLLAIIEMRARTEQDARALDRRLLSVEEVRSAIDRMQELGFGDEYLLRQIIKLLSIERRKRVFVNLERLLKGEHPALEQPSGVPGAFTLSGFGIRKDGALQLSSPLIARVARRHLTRPRIAHIHAEAGRFEEAFASVSESDLSATGWNAFAIAGTIRAASAELHRRASLGRKALWQFFDSVCRRLLGLSEVSFWEFRARWEMTFCEPTVPMQRACRAALDLDYEEPGPLRGPETFGSPPSGPNGILIPPLWAGSILGWRLAGLSGKWQFALFVGTAAEKNAPPTPMVDLLREFVAVFQQAHKRAVEEERRERHTRFLNVVSEMVRTIDRLFVERDPTVQDILQQTSALLTIGYAYIACSLVDPADGQIHDISVHGEGDRLLRPSGAASLLSQYVVRTGETRVVTDVHTNDLTKVDPRWAGQHGALAVCPILGAGEAAIGAIEFSRHDGQVPSQEEIDDFQALASKLAMFVEQSKRLRLLQGTLDRNREALVIFDSLCEPIYADRQAATMFGFRPGWTIGLDQMEGNPTSTMSHLSDIGSTALRDGNPIAQLYPTEGGIFSIHGDILKGWSGRPAGFFLSILDFSEEYRVFDAFMAIAHATDVESGFESLLKAVRILGHRWARIYWHEHNSLKSSRFQYGLEGREKEMFEQGEVCLEGAESWRCLKENRVVVFCKTKVDHTFRTALGVDVRGITQTTEGIVSKEAGQFWIEAPLIAGAEWLGTISLQGAPDLRVEKVAFLQAFFRLVARLLEALSRGKRDRTELVGRSISTYAHILHSQVTRLDQLISSYKELESDYNEQSLQTYNALFRTNRIEILESLERAMQSFSDTPPRYERCDLFAVVRRVFPSKDVAYEGPNEFFMDADPWELQTVFLELLSNSRKWMPIGLVITIRVSDVAVGDALWCQVDIQDNGPGFSETMRRDDAAFDYFSRHSPGKDQPPGTGLGLAIVRQHIRSHGGMVEILPGPGAGIRIRLPRWRKHAPRGRIVA